MRLIAERLLPSDAGPTHVQGEVGCDEEGSNVASSSVSPPAELPRVHASAYNAGASKLLRELDLTPSPLPLEGGEPGDVSDLLAACNAYVDNIVSENQRMRSKLLSCRTKLGSTSAEPVSGRK